jgi:NAD(P)H dehydrogenase (quinone)
MKTNKILIAYSSRTGNTEKLAQAVAEGVRKVEGVTVDLKRARDVKPGDAISSEGFAFGSNSAFEYMAGELKTLFEELYSIRDKLSGKPTLLFSTGKGGQVAVLESMEGVVGIFNPRWIKPGVAVEGLPGESDREKAIVMGKKLAEAVKK